MVQKYEPATPAKSAMEMTILWGLVVTLVCPPLATCGTTPETATTTTRPFDGASLATFRPSTGFAQMRIGNTSETDTVISLRFKTRYPDGLLAYFGGPTYLALSLRGGGLVLHLKTQENRTGSTSTFGNDFNDGNWHQISVRRMSNITYLQYNMEDLLGYGVFSKPGELHTDQLFIGGAPDAALPADFQWRTSFRGCIQDVRFASFLSSDPKDPEKLYFHRDSFSGWPSYLNTCAESSTCGWFECLDYKQNCNLGVCECGSSYQVLSEDPLVCGRINPTTYMTFTEDSMHRTSSNGAFPEDGGFPSEGNHTECTNETAFDLNPPTYQEVVAVTDVNPTLTETSTEPPSANQETELSNHDRGVQQQVRPLLLPSSTSGSPSNYEGNQVPPEGQRSPGVPPPSYESFMEYSKTPPGSLEALDVHILVPPGDNHIIPAAYRNHRHDDSLRGLTDFWRFSPKHAGVPVCGLLCLVVPGDLHRVSANRQLRPRWNLPQTDKSANSLTTLMFSQGEKPRIAREISVPAFLQKVGAHDPRLHSDTDWSINTGCDRSDGARNPGRSAQHTAPRPAELLAVALAPNS
ncbi:hypothetical protein Bbelb_173990 [Branchiostoma belcheri]|nr:hypothetical protein Bbelb_173990 [Branchiostoma belcheri]